MLSCASIAQSDRLGRVSWRLFLVDHIPRACTWGAFELAGVPSGSSPRPRYPDCRPVSCGSGCFQIHKHDGYDPESRTYERISFPRAGGYAARADQSRGQRRNSANVPRLSLWASALSYATSQRTRFWVRPDRFCRVSLTSGDSNQAAQGQAPNTVESRWGRPFSPQAAASRFPRRAPEIDARGLR